MTIFTSENIYLGLTQTQVTSKGLDYILNPWMCLQTVQGFFISTNSRRFTHPRPTQKIGSQIGVGEVNKVVSENGVSKNPALTVKTMLTGNASRKVIEADELEVGDVPTLSLPWNKVGVVSVEEAILRINPNQCLNSHCGVLVLL